MAQKPQKPRTAKRSALRLVATNGIGIPRTVVDAERVNTQLRMIFEKMQSVNQKYDKRVQRLQAQIAELETERTEIIHSLDVNAHAQAAALHRFAEQNRDELTQRGRIKTVTLPDDSWFRWRISKALDIEDEEAFFAEVKKKGLADKFIRVKEEPNKKAMQDNPKDTDLLTSVQSVEHERFRIQPRGTDYYIERELGEHGMWEVKRNE